MKKILILGGDKRQKVISEKLKISGIDTDIYCLGNYDTLPFPKTDFYDAVILGIPSTRDGIYISSAYTDKRIKLTDIKSFLKPSGYLFAALLPGKNREYFSSNNINVFDYYNREEVAVKNVVPTAEGAIAVAINESDITLHGSQCLITGYGRIGKYLSHLLSSLGASVSVSARKTEDLAWIKAYGYTPVSTYALEEHISAYDFIFNTIPYPVIDKKIISKIKKEALITELASSPGGIDKEAARDRELKVITASSLPGKTAPVTSGNIIAETIEDIIRTEVLL